MKSIKKLWTPMMPLSPPLSILSTHPKSKCVKSKYISKITPNFHKENNCNHQKTFANNNSSATSTNTATTTTSTTSSSLLNCQQISSSNIKNGYHHLNHLNSFDKYPSSLNQPHLNIDSNHSSVFTITNV